CGDSGCSDLTLLLLLLIPLRELEAPTTFILASDFWLLAPAISIAFGLEAPTTVEMGGGAKGGITQQLRRNLGFRSKTGGVCGAKLVVLVVEVVASRWFAAIGSFG